MILGISVMDMIQGLPGAVAVGMMRELGEGYAWGEETGSGLGDVEVLRMGQGRSWEG